MDKEILEYSYRLLSKKDYTEYELKSKFKSRFPDGAGFFEQVINKLKKYNYINDDKFFINFVKLKASERYGPYYIKIKLQEKGIYKSKEEIEEIFDNDFNQVEIIKELLKKKKYSSKKYDMFKIKKKYFDFFVRRGFDINKINVVLQEELIDESNFS